MGLIDLFKRDSGSSGDAQEVYGLRGDVLRYYGWAKAEVKADRAADKTVHMLEVIGYMEYDEDDRLVLTSRGSKLMKGVVMPSPAES